MNEKIFTATRPQIASGAQCNTSRCVSQYATADSFGRFWFAHTCKAPGSLRRLPYKVHMFCPCVMQVSEMNILQALPRRPPSLFWQLWACFSVIVPQTRARAEGWRSRTTPSMQLTLLEPLEPFGGECGGGETRELTHRAAVGRGRHEG